MTQHGILLYGGPASGKDTIAAELAEHGRCRPFPRLKHGPGRTHGYRIASAKDLEKAKGTPGEVIWTTTRYSATYLIDKSHLLKLLSSGDVPVIQLGEPAAVTAVLKALPYVHWTIVELWCPRHIAYQRIIERNTGDTDERMHHYDNTPHLPSAHLSLDTSQTLPEACVQTILNTHT